MNRTDNPEVPVSIDACWDDAGVWSASSADAAGLAVEAATKDALIEPIRVAIPELLELNHASARQAKPVELLISGRQSFALYG